MVPLGTETCLRTRTVQASVQVLVKNGERMWEPAGETEASFLAPSGWPGTEFYLQTPPKYFDKGTNCSLWILCSYRLCLLCKESSPKSMSGDPVWLNMQALNFTATLSDWKNSISRQFPSPPLKQSSIRHTAPSSRALVHWSHLTVAVGAVLNLNSTLTHKYQWLPLKWIIYKKKYIHCHPLSNWKRILVQKVTN